MPEEKKEVRLVDPSMIDKQELTHKITTITDNLLQIESFRELNNEIVKEIKEAYGFNATAIRSAAQALFKRKKEELEEKQIEIMTIIELVESAKRRSASDL
jgi:hypothetical protein